MNFRSFLDFGTASQAKILTARKSDFANVSKSTISLKIGSILTLEKSIFSTVFAAGAATEDLEDFLSESKDFIVGKSSTSRIAGEFVNNITRRSIPYPIPPVGGIPISRAFKKSSSVVFASSSPAARAASCALKRSLWSIGSFNSEYALHISRA